MSEKIWGHVAGEGEFENRGQEPQRRPKRAQKIEKYEIFIGLAIAHHFSVRGRGGKGVGVTLEVRLHGLMVKGRRWR